MVHHWFKITAAGLAFLGLNLAGGVSALSAASSATASLEVGLHVTSNCTVRTEPLDFGSLNESDAPGAVAASSIEVACTESTPFVVMLDDGLNGGAGARRALDPATGKYVSYDIYIDPAHTDRWGGLGSEVSGLSGFGAVTRLQAYGAISSTQVAAGDYRDTVTVTVTY